MPRKSGEFRLQGKFLLLTYKHHLPKASYKRWLSDKHDCNTIEIAHEAPEHEGDQLSGKTPYEHTHVVVEFKKMLDISSPRHFDVKYKKEIVHPNIKKLVGTKAFKDGLGYISKEDPDCAHLSKFKETNIVKRVMNADSLVEALEDNVDRLSDATGVIAIFNAKQAISEVRQVDLEHDWQRSVYRDITINNLNRRHIRWFYDPVGGSGKTMFLKYMIQEHNDNLVWFKRFGGSNGMSHLVAEAIKNGKDPKFVICDLPRYLSDSHNIYECLEDLVDGLITSTKYNGGCFHFNTPHILVFSNFLPDVVKMSQDRWIIKHISEGILHDMTYEQVKAINDEEKED
jgi:hypothetical protein